MQSASKQNAEGERIKRNLVLPVDGPQSGLGEMLAPLRAALIVIRQDNAVRAIAYPIHELQGLKIEPIVGHVVLDKNVTPADPARFGKKSLDSVRMVQDVHEHAHFK